MPSRSLSDSVSDLSLILLSLILTLTYHLVYRKHLLCFLVQRLSALAQCPVHAVSICHCGVHSVRLVWGVQAARSHWQAAAHGGSFPSRGRIGLPAALLASSPTGFTVKVGSWPITSLILSFVKHF